MSLLARQFFREMRPLFRMLEEPLGRSSHPVAGVPPVFRPEFFGNAFTQPAIDVADRGDKFVLEADLPGVKKDNIELRIGDNGRSVTIEGKITEKGETTANAAQSGGDTTNSASDSSAVTKVEQSTQLTTERPYTRNVSFTRTVWFPRPVDTSDVSAKLENGVLTVIVKKGHDKSDTTIPIS